VPRDGARPSGWVRGGLRRWVLGNDGHRAAWRPTPGARGRQWRSGWPSCRPANARLGIGRYGGVDDGGGGDLAGPVAEALRAAVGRSDLGDATPSCGLPEALANVAAHRWGWQVDPAQVTLTPEVGVAVVEVLGLLARPGDRVVINPPVYDWFFPWLAEVGCRPLGCHWRRPPTGGRWTWTPCRPRPRTGPTSTCCAHRITRPASSTGATTRAAGGAGRPLRRRASA
jgi:hypothetical protein